MKSRSEKGKIDLNNNSGSMQLAGSITNNDGNIALINSGAGGMLIASAGRVENIKSDTTITNTAGDLTIADGAQIINNESGNIKVANKGSKFNLQGLIKHFGQGNINTENEGDEFNIANTGKIIATEGDILVSNKNAGALNVDGLIIAIKGETTINNSSVDGMKITSNGVIQNKRL